MKKMTELAVEGKTVFLRTEFNVALDKELRVVDDSRIKASLPTIEWLINNGARIVICAHLGRPWGTFDEKKSLKHIVAPLSKLLGKNVKFASDCIGSARMEAQRMLQPSEVLLLENVRFHKNENDNDTAFSQSLAEGIDIYINDAFGNCHRPHASMIGVPRYIKKKAVGFLVEHELNAINSFLNSADHPSVAIVGGAKVAGKDGKIHVIRNLLRILDTGCVVGKIAYYFLNAQGISIGATISSDLRSIDSPDTNLEQSSQDCLDVLEQARKQGRNIVLPIDSVVTLPSNTEPIICNHENGSFPGGAAALDIGPRSSRSIAEIIKNARSVIWNGPAGYFEDSRFRSGTLAIANAIKASQAKVLIGGGDTIAALGDWEPPADRVHICTGGGAMLSMLMGRELCAIEALES